MVVADMIAPNAFVNIIMECRGWTCDSVVINPLEVENYKKIIEKTSSLNLEEQAMRLFKDFISIL